MINRSDVLRGEPLQHELTLQYSIMRTIYKISHLTLRTQFPCGWIEVDESRQVPDITQKHYFFYQLLYKIIYTYRNTKIKINKRKKLTKIDNFNTNNSKYFENYIVSRTYYAKYSLKLKESNFS